MGTNLPLASELYPPSSIHFLPLVFPKSSTFQPPIGTKTSLLATS